jgi:tetratricopeptide (TPR) repeat protein
MTTTRSNRYIFPFLFVLLLLISATAMAQPPEKRYMYRGNSLFRAKKYADAEVCYRKALEHDPNNARIRYNLGNTLLSQRKPKDAMKQYERAVEMEKNPFYKAAMYHNMGVILQSQKQFGPAIECYKNSLRNYPIDDRTRYNLALCQYQLKNQKQNNKQQNQQNKKNQDKNKKNKPQNQNKPQSKPQQQQDKNQISKENADQMLRAAMMQESKTQEKVRRAMQQQRRKNVDMNW